MTMTRPESGMYDRVLYPGHALAQAHPDRLATIATLFGIKPPEVSRCRLLELGCGDGLNLISVGLGLPEARCVGIDLALSGIARGQEIIRGIGLENVTLLQRSIVDIDRDFGQYDFIVAHGVYSWVPPEVRDKLLIICQENLVDNGVAYVSYNAYPGSRQREMVREMMRYHVAEFADPNQKIEQARALIDFLAEHARTEGDVYRSVLDKERERIREFADSSLFHDDLAEENVAVYFTQFVEHAARHGLQYLSEAHFTETQAGVFPANVVAVLNQMADGLIAKEQYLDFLKGRRFRQTLLCHAACELDRIPRPERMAQFSFASPLRTDAPRAELQSRSVVAFAGPLKSSISTNNPLIKGALAALGEAWPRAVHFRDLLGAAHGACGRRDECDGPSVDEDVRVLGDMLLRAYAGGIVEVYGHPPQFALQPGERPVASPLARLQSREDGRVTNLRHYTIEIENPLGRYLLGRLDGSRDRAALLDDLAALVESGALTLRTDGSPAHDGRHVREQLAAELERQLMDLGERALLVA
jgi:methyltransferase-like protein/cyclopropane fatty-acyl-phospholipid synthase-like methyltransferase